MYNINDERTPLFRIKRSSYRDTEVSAKSYNSIMDELEEFNIEDSSNIILVYSNSKLLKIGKVIQVKPSEKLGEDLCKRCLWNKFTDRGNLGCRGFPCMADPYLIFSKIVDRFISLFHISKYRRNRNDMNTLIVRYG